MYTIQKKKFRGSDTSKDKYKYAHPGLIKKKKIKHKLRRANEGKTTV